MTKLNWLTNDPVAAQILRDADARYELAKARASNLTLAAKVDALRKARAERDKSYRVAALPV